MVRIKVKGGDVFSMDLSNGQYGFGQVLANDSGLLQVGVYDHISDGQQIDILSLTAHPFIIIEHVVDLFFDLGRWVIVGSLPIEKSIDKFPVYKVLTPVGVKMMDKNGKILDADDQVEHFMLPSHSTYSPISFSNALEVWKGIQDHDPYFDKLLMPKRILNRKQRVQYKYRLSSQRVISWTVFVNFLLVVKYLIDYLSLQCEPCLPDTHCPPCETSFMLHIVWYLCGVNIFMGVLFLSTRKRVVGS